MIVAFNIDINNIRRNHSVIIIWLASHETEQSTFSRDTHHHHHHHPASTYICMEKFSNGEENFPNNQFSSINHVFMIAILIRMEFCLQKSTQLLIIYFYSTS